MEDTGCLLSPFLPLAIIAGLLGVFLVIPVQSETDIIATVVPAFKVSQADESMMAQLEEAEALWNSQNLGGYTITVYNGRHLSSLEPTIMVVDGEVVESSAVCWVVVVNEADCVPPPFDPVVYTVPGLFDTIRNVLKYSDLAAIKQLEFDTTYGYPTRLSYDDSHISGEEWWITVERFEVN